MNFSIEPKNTLRKESLWTPTTLKHDNYKSCVILRKINASKSSLVHRLIMSSIERLLLVVEVSNERITSYISSWKTQVQSYYLPIMCAILSYGYLSNVGFGLEKQTLCPQMSSLSFFGTLWFQCFKSVFLLVILSGIPVDYLSISLFHFIQRPVPRNSYSSFCIFDGLLYSVLPTNWSWMCHLHIKLFLECLNMC